jgi:FMN reductase
MRPNSSSEKVLRSCLNLLSNAGAQTAMFSGKALALPMYEAGAAARSQAAVRIVDAVRSCDALVITSPGYHGALSGLVKNTIDYIEELREDARPYLHGRPVGCIACASGWQAAASTLASLRSIAHALRGWPTPMGAMINTSMVFFDKNERCNDERVIQQLQVICDQILTFVRTGQTRYPQLA